MTNKKPSIFKMIRASFLTSVIASIIAGTLLSVKLSGSMNILGFIIVLIIGIATHIATNVYNDIYDTLQGNDTINTERNEFSGGSGVLQSNPELMGKMFSIARISLAVAFLFNIALMFFINKELWPILWIIFFVSAFFSKYYTAAPIKLAYRGLGEISVWLAFGPLATLMAALGQNLPLSNELFILMPICGLSTLSILLIGQIIDIEADKSAGKNGVASKLGTRITSFIYTTVQCAIIINIVALYLFSSISA
jgi:1,4-dihydroxy-2-naphthoate octaprenyltransferase